MSAATTSTQQPTSRHITLRVFSAPGGLVRQTLAEGWSKAGQWLSRRMPFQSWGHSTPHGVSSETTSSNASTIMQSLRGEGGANVNDMLRSGSVFTSSYSVVMVIMVRSDFQDILIIADFSDFPSFNLLYIVPFTTAPSPQSNSTHRCSSTRLLRLPCLSAPNLSPP